MRGRREDRREERQDDRQLGRPGGDGNRYQMRQKMVSIGDDFWIENEQGQKVYKIDGKALRVRQTLIFEDAHGKELCKIQERMLRANGRLLEFVRVPPEIVEEALEMIASAEGKLEAGS